MPTCYTICSFNKNNLNVWLHSVAYLLGIGAGIGAGIFAQIARTTTEKERTGIFSIAMGLRQFGLLVGMSIWC